MHFSWRPVEAEVAKFNEKNPNFKMTGQQVRDKIKLIKKWQDQNDEEKKQL